MLKSNLNIENRLSIIGIVTGNLKRRKSPNGIEHCQFLLEHRSNQVEANLIRQAWCKIPVQVSGNQLVEKTQGITVGNKVLVQGFLTTHQLNNGSTQLVLHAEQIEFID
ncbi:primosomal replication protein N [uncultured Aggregatibacter sp.]|uniref:primosomal replication protein N n=1 Tax=uncultured Aggregatibacter sp. TaxID=470564 RepID=UPI002804B20D|nr:primosomal replication protein N [uncultured Aggregatibacter sp.]